MKRVIEISGSRENAQPLELGAWKDLVRVEPLAAVRVAAARDLAAPPALIEASDDDVVEVEFSDGARLWMRVDEIPTELNIEPARDTAQTLRIPPTVSARGATERGLGSLAVAAVRVFHVDEALAGLTAKKLAATLEERREPGDGLYACPQPGSLEKAAKLSGTDPILVFVHGTMSSTGGAFGKLGLDSPFGPSIWPEIEKRYPRRILAFEHRTLSESPIESALKLAHSLAEIVPVGAELHVISHSRGGHIGDLLARGQRTDKKAAFDDVDLQMFTDAKDPRWGERAPGYLRDLNLILRAQNWRIGHFARVASTTRGTLLASGRLDRWLSLLLNVIGLTPGLAGNPIYGFTKATLLAFAKQRTRPDELPGLAAQMPGSPLVAVLNRQDVEVGGKLFVIAGDCEGRGIWGTLKILAADLFYREDHDLVVQTAGMDGGPRRSEGTFRYLDRGGEVDHFHYFANPATRTRLLSAIDGVPAGFELPGAVSRAPEVKLEGQTESGKPYLFLLPGIMGSHLQVAGDRIWVGYDNLLLGKLDLLALDSGKTALPDGAVASGYQKAASFFTKSHFVEIFSYDWRRSLREAAAAFATALDQRLRSDLKRPVRVLAHSMGGLVAQLAFAERPDVWEEFRRRLGCRLVMAGTPSRGSWSIVGVVLGQDRMVRLLSAMDLKHSKREILNIVSRFPGILEMLPAPTEDWDFFDSKAWDRLAGSNAQTAWIRPADDLLDAARQVHKRLTEAPVDPNRMFYVAGVAEGTPDRIALDGGHPRVRPLGAGDGRALWTDGPPPGIPIWYRNAVHGDLLAGDFEAYVEILEQGSTARLKRQPPATRSAARSVVDDHDLGEPIGSLPSPEELESAILGGEVKQACRTGRQPLRLSVVHGNIVYARSPTAVGHYLGDGLFSAEADLDRRLEGALRKRLAVGIYPGVEGTAEVFLPAGREDVGAIVVGLGRIGELTPGALSEGVARGALRYALTIDERRGQNGGASLSARRFSSLLIGSTEGSALTLEDSLRAILSGVATANRTLQKLAALNLPLLEEVEIIELWEDRALQAARLVSALADAGDVEVASPEEPLIRGAGGLRRAFEQPRSGWWQRLQIQQQPNGNLSFISQTDKARVDTRLVPTQIELVRELVRLPATSIRTDPEIGVTLFELLLPDELKNLSQKEQRLVFQVDPVAAQFPWELLIDRGTDSDAGRLQVPLSVRTGLVRQLETQIFRERLVRSDRRTALVVSDPAAITGLAPLPGARAEAREVCKALREREFDVEVAGRFEKSETAGIDPLSLLKKLMGRGYQVIHLAGHGVHDPEDPKRSGLVIGSTAKGGNLTFHLLTAAEIRQLREVPDLVFVNACHLGRSDETTPGILGVPDRVALAANLGIELIRMGVRVVIAAGWEVDDSAARTFASAFYRAFLAGVVFGEAIQKARSETHTQHPSVNTWGAYQCYGDPYFSLRGPQAVQGISSAWVDPIEARDEINNLASDLKVPQKDGGRTVRDRLGQLERALPAAWTTTSMVAASLARVYQELGDFDRALACYNQTFKGEAAGVGLEAFEQWVKAVIRDSYERFRQGRVPGTSQPGEARAWANREIRSAIDRLDELSKLGTTADRLALRASAFKRLAHINDDLTLLKAASRSYKKAVEQKELAYFQVNYALCVLLGDVNPPVQSSPHLLSIIDTAERLANEQKERRPIFESTINVADAKLLRALIEGKLEDSTVRSAVTAEYRGVLERGVTPLEARGMEDQFCILLWRLKGAQQRQVEQVRQELSDGLDLAKG